MEKGYYRILLRRIKEEALRDLGWNKKTLLPPLLAFVVGSAIYFVLMGHAKLIEKCVEFFAFAFAPVCLLTVGYLIFHLFRTPTVIHNEQRASILDQFNKIIELEYKLSGGGIDIEITPTTRHSGKYASLRVYNKNELISVFCKPYPRKIFHMYTPTQILDMTEHINEYNKPLSWDGGSDSPEIEIRPRKEEFINIARLSGNQTVFTFFGPEKQFTLGKYKVLIDVDCRENLSENRFHTETFIGCIDTTPRFLDQTNISIGECDNAEWGKEAEQEEGKNSEQ